MSQSIVEFCRETSNVLLSLYSSYVERASTLDREDYDYRQVLKFCRHKAIDLGTLMDVAARELAAETEDEAFDRLKLALDDFPWEEPIMTGVEVHHSAFSLMSYVREGLITATLRRTAPKLAELKPPRIRY